MSELRDLAFTKPPKICGLCLNSGTVLKGMMAIRCTCERGKVVRDCDFLGPLHPPDVAWLKSRVVAD